MPDLSVDKSGREPPSQGRPRFRGHQGARARIGTGRMSSRPSPSALALRATGSRGAPLAPRFRDPGAQPPQGRSEAISRGVV